MHDLRSRRRHGMVEHAGGDASARRRPGRRARAPGTRRTIVAAPPSARSVEAATTARPAASSSSHAALRTGSEKVRRLDTSAPRPATPLTSVQARRRQCAHLDRFAGELVSARDWNERIAARAASRSRCSSRSWLRRPPAVPLFERVELGRRVLAQPDGHVHARVLVHQLRELVEPAFRDRLHRRGRGSTPQTGPENHVSALCSARVGKRRAPHRRSTCRTARRRRPAELAQPAQRTGAEDRRLPAPLSIAVGSTVKRVATTHSRRSPRVRAHGRRRTVHRGQGPPDALRPLKGEARSSGDPQRSCGRLRRQRRHGVRAPTYSSDSIASRSTSRVRQSCRSRLKPRKARQHGKAVVDSFSTPHAPGTGGGSSRRIPQPRNGKWLRRSNAA